MPWAAPGAAVPFVHATRTIPVRVSAGAQRRQARPHAFCARARGRARCGRFPGRHRRGCGSFGRIGCRRPGCRGRRIPGDDWLARRVRGAARSLAGVGRSAGRARRRRCRSRHRSTPLPSATRWTWRPPTSATRSKGPTRRCSRGFVRPLPLAAAAGARKLVRCGGIRGGERRPRSRSRCPRGSSSRMASGRLLRLPAPAPRRLHPRGARPAPSPQRASPRMRRHPLPPPLRLPRHWPTRPRQQRPPPPAKRCRLPARTRRPTQPGDFWAARFSWLACCGLDLTCPRSLMRCRHSCLNRPIGRHFARRFRWGRGPWRPE